MKDYLAVGKIVNTHGIKGELKITPLTSDISRFDYLLFASVKIDGAMKELRVSSARYHKNFVLLKFSGIETLEEAEKLKGLDLWVDRQHARPLDEDEYFICDMIGLDVYEDDVLLGKLTEVIQTGSNDVYTVTSEDREILLPALKSVVLSIDMEQRKMFVKIPEGLLDEI